MRIALFSDVHGNLVALRTLLAHLQTQDFDAIYCLGDLFTPYPGSAEIWERVKAAGVQCVLGNNEAALLAQCSGEQDYHAEAVRFQPFLRNAEEIKPYIEEIRAIPASRSILVGPHSRVHICHFSPGEVFRGLHSIFDFSLQDYLRQVPEQIVITGHLHIFGGKDLNGKQVYTVGSAGLPLKGSQQLEFSVIEEQHGQFTITHQLLPYPFEEELAYLRRAGFLRDYGPVAWLAFDEILTQRDRMVPFIKDFLPVHTANQSDYPALVEEFLRSIGRWETLEAEIRRQPNNSFKEDNQA